MRRPFIVFLATVCCLSISCGPKPLPNDKLVFVGQWEAHSGFTIDIKANGTAELTQYLDHTDPDYERLCIKVGPPIIKDIPLTFKGDDVLEVSKTMLYARTYKIEQPPYQDGDHIKMVLNGVTLIKQ